MEMPVIAAPPRPAVLAPLQRTRRWLATLVLGIALVVTGLPGFVGAAGNAQAQERQRPNLLDVLRGNRRDAKPQRQRKRATKRRSTRKQRRSTTRAGTQRRATKQRAARTKRSGARTKRRKPVLRSSDAPAAVVESVAPVEKSDNAKVALVVGDFLAHSLAEGLEDAFADLPGVKVVKVSMPSSGLVRDDHFDWPERLPELIEEHDPAVVLLVLGGNDGQPIRMDGAVLAKGTEEWASEYRARAEEVARLVTRAGRPLVWVGAPPFRQQRLNADMVDANRHFEAAARATGAAYVDVWDGFTDQSGAYVRSGPDIEGRAVRLRTKDGLNFTSAGQRKLAFFAEKDVRRLLGSAVVTDFGTIGADSLAPLGDDLLDAPLQPASLPPITLSDPALDGANGLLGAADAVAGPVAPAVNPSLVPKDTGPPSDRVDNFAWPPQG